MRHFVSTFHRAIAALLLVAGVASATPIDLSTPTGLNPGDKFRFLAVTSNVTTAYDPNITSYNQFVQNDFGGATYGGVLINWKAIGSTVGVDARDNVGGFGTSVPVFKPSGTRLADNLTGDPGGLWGGTLLAEPNETLSGVLGAERIWTGSVASGQVYVTRQLGHPSAVQVGRVDRSTFRWLDDTNVGTGGSYRMYGLSEELTVGGGSPVPEIDPAGMGSVLALVGGALGMLERRRRRTP